MVVKSQDAGDAGTDLLAKALENPVELFTSDAKFSEFYDRVKAETDRLVPDVSSQKGRDAIRSMSRKVVTTKTAIDKAAKDLTEGWRRQTSEVNASRKKMVEDLADLADTVRKPLTDWEEAEDERVKNCRAAIDWFQRCSVVTIQDTAATVADRGNEVYEYALLDPVTFDGFFAEACAARDLAVKVLFEAMKRLQQEEADKAELEALRAKEVEREAQSAKDRAEQEALAEKAAQEAIEKAQEVERQRTAELAEASERAAQEAREASLAAAKHEVDAANARADEAETEAYARSVIQYINEVKYGFIGGEPQSYGIIQRELSTKIVAGESFGHMRDEVEKARVEALAFVESAHAASLAKRDTQAAEDAENERRAADLHHRVTVKKTIKEALIALGASEEISRAIVIAAEKGKIPYLKVEF